MFDFLKQLFNNPEDEVTVVLLDDEHPEGADSYQVRPKRLWAYVYGGAAALVAVTLLLLMFTPLGALLYNQEDAELRRQVIEVSKRVQALQDSLQARDMQLYDIQQVLMSNADTSFRVDSSVELPGTLTSGGGRQELPGRRSPTGALPAGTQGAPPGSQGGSEIMQDPSAGEMLSQNEIIFSELFARAPEFPARYPVQGTLTRGYNAANRHFGIDIATTEGSAFYALADGSVVSRDWSVNYGYVIHVQHVNGLLSVYKHVTEVTKEVGDVVLRGDILGKVGDTGVLSSGPHLHLEIWKNGVPQNPNSYLINP